MKNPTHYQDVVDFVRSDGFAGDEARLVTLLRNATAPDDSVLRRAEELLENFANTTTSPGWLERCEEVLRDIKRLRGEAVPSGREVIVTRHPALAQVLREDHGVEGDVFDHVVEGDVRGAVVWGVLPLHLAALAAEVRVIDLDLPADMRGVELTADQVRLYARGRSVSTYRVEEVYE